MDGAVPSHFSAMFPNLEASGSGKAQEVSPGSVGLRCLDTELQKMLIDERMRCENHKTNYQTLKAEHSRLQGEYTRAQGELKRMLSEKQAGQEKLQLLLAELRREVLDKTRELEELRLQVMTPQRLELLRAQVQQEMEIPIKEHFSKLEEEAEKYRSEYNKLRYDFTFLKSEFDHQREEHEHILEEQRIRYSADLALLERDKEKLSAQLQSGDCASDGKRVEALLREKAQLHQRLCNLEAEVAELRAERDNTGAQAENTQRIQLRQLAESQAALKTLESEKQSVCMQLDRVEKDLRLSHEQNAVLTGKLHKAEREINALNSQVEEIKHAHRLELANVKMEYLKARGEVERERDKLQTQVESLQSDLEVLTATGERNKELLLEKEQEMVLRIQGAREEEMQKIVVLQEEKFELENRLSELEQLRALQEETGTTKNQEFEDRLRGAWRAEESARKELQNIKVKLQQQAQQLEELERQKTENTELRRHNAELNVQISTLSYSERELMDANGRLRESLERVREELRSARTQMERTQQEAESCPLTCYRLEEERRVEWFEEKHKLQEREAELQEKYSQAKQRMEKASLAQKKRKTLNKAKEKKQQDKLQLMEAKIEELEIESSVAKKNPSFAEEHAQLSRRLAELQRRHKEFRQLLLGNHMPSMSLPHSLLVAGPECSFINVQHLQQLSGLQRRLEELENNQQQQLQELTPPLDRDREQDRRLAPPDSLPNL
ncbi:centrosomal protein of 83 kDa isoform X1 [Ictalurus furcatus]|uniref:centrosomal protein of 83 kDa isoform X1 n=2 Tax=Ictalurus furcatus TaxID=66913 RepID=UPI0023509AF5|nr:centrosomal protein of 83 kDa isoform X1 [Ictalurus furcatus]XP_053497841.1 centrosomal protein of 83 kDa isoform X1 [Ictalurus furcatus]XP_053497842.1 centrosomal protein of 83 kDa isoform X1 [Ictalurus furcatus]XP_053497843.1 centrosomal protein of 83 kDa isoform X1 [Ictalurus furcatus]